MNRLTKTFYLTVVFLTLLFLNTVNAGEVKILAADFKGSSDNRWSVSVTLKHADTGWDHYADNWRVVDGEGNVLGERVLYHPHVEEQPFTRSLNHVEVPDGVSTVYIEAHDKVHGWSPNRLEVDLGKARGEHLQIEAD